MVVCGHTGCGGVKGAMMGRAGGLREGGMGEVEEWLGPLREVKEEGRGVLERVKGEAEKRERLGELNVRRSVGVVRGIRCVRDAMGERGLRVHGAVFDIGKGLVRELDCEEEVQAETNGGASQEADGVANGMVSGQGDWVKEKAMKGGFWKERERSGLAA